MQAETIRLTAEAGSTPCVLVRCLHCRLALVGDQDTNGATFRDVLATHWYDDHHISAWQSEATRARSRLWKTHPDLLARLVAVSASFAATHRGRVG